MFFYEIKPYVITSLHGIHDKWITSRRIALSPQVVNWGWNPAKNNVMYAFKPVGEFQVHHQGRPREIFGPVKRANPSFLTSSFQHNLILRSLPTMRYTDIKCTYFTQVSSQTNRKIKSKPHTAISDNRH